MRENSWTIKEELTRGLSQDFRHPRNTGAMSRLLNLRATELGLAGLPVISHPWIDQFEAHGIREEFPWPQIFRGKGETLIADRAAIYKADPCTGELSRLVTYDAANPDTETAIQTGCSPWTFADMQGGWMLFNGVCVVMKTGDGPTLVSEAFPTSCGCDAGFQVFTGGFDPTIKHPVWEELDSNVVAWSKVGGGDATWPYIPGNMRHDIHEEHVLRNEAGYLQMPWSGKIFGLIPLGKGVVVYGEEGVAALFPASATWGMKKILPLGILGRITAGGDDNGHVFIDERGNLWRMGPDFGTELLRQSARFSEWLKQCRGMVTISKDSIEEEYYIASGDGGFVLSKTGLAEMSGNVTSLVTADRKLSGVEYGGSRAFEFTTDTYDMGYRTFKSIERVQIAANDVTGLEARTEFKDLDSGKWRGSPWTRFNREGWAVPKCSGVDLRVAIRGTAGPQAKIDYLTIHWKNDDKRPLRGLVSNAGETAA